MDSRLILVSLLTTVFIQISATWGRTNNGDGKVTLITTKSIHILFNSPVTSHQLSSIPHPRLSLFQTQHYNNTGYSSARAGREMSFKFLNTEYIECFIIHAATALIALKSLWENYPPNWVGLDPCGSSWEGIGCYNQRVISMYVHSSLHPVRFFIHLEDYTYPYF